MSQPQLWGSDSESTQNVCHPCAVDKCNSDALEPCNMCEVHMQELLLKAAKERSNPGKGKKEKKPKKEGPPRKKSAYLLFCQDKRPEVKEQNPEWKQQQIISELGRLWNLAKENGEADKYKEDAEEQTVSDSSNES